MVYYCYKTRKELPTMDFKERVFQARKAKGFSQEDLAALVGVSRQAVSKWETGEAMPDMEKLVALCDALDLNMEYLALGKESAAPAETPKKSRWWIAALLAAVFLVSGLLLGYYLLNPPVQTPTQAEGSLPILVPIDPSVSNVVVSVDDQNSLEVAILPAQIAEGLTVEVLCEDNVYYKTETLPCTLDGNYYRVTLPRPEIYRYNITMILSDGSRKAQIPLVEISGDLEGFTTTHLWMSSK